MHHTAALGAELRSVSNPPFQLILASRCPVDLMLAAHPHRHTHTHTDTHSDKTSPFTPTGGGIVPAQPSCDDAWPFLYLLSPETRAL